MAVLLVAVLMDHSLMVARGIQVARVLGMLVLVDSRVVLVSLRQLTSNIVITVVVNSLFLQPFNTQLAIDRFQFKDANYWIGLGILYNLAAYAFVLLLSSVSTRATSSCD